MAREVPWPRPLAFVAAGRGSQPARTGEINAGQLPPVSWDVVTTTARAYHIRRDFLPCRGVAVMTDNFNQGVMAPVNAADESLVSYTHVIYALHALSILIGLTSA